MDRATLTAALRRHTGGAEVITKTQLQAFMGIRGPQHIQRYVDRLDALDGKYYLVSEVAAELMRHVR